MITVRKLIEELQKCNPEAVVVPFTYDREMGIDIECVSADGNYYSCWDKYQVIESHIASGREVVILSDFDLIAKYGYDDED